MNQTKQFEKAAADCVVRSAGGVSVRSYEREAPDVDLLHERGFHIGLEIVRTVDQLFLDVRKRLIAASEVVQGELEAQGVLGSFWVYFDLAEMGSEASFPRAWQRDVPKRLAAFLATCADTTIDKSRLEVHGITRIRRIERSPALRTFVGCGWSSSPSLRGTLVDIALKKKHERLRYYRAHNGDYFQQYWLAIASVGPGVLEDGGYQMLLEKRYETDYDRVFLLFHSSNGTLQEANDVTPVRTKLSRC